MVSRSSYDELMFAYEERGRLLFEAVHLLNKASSDELLASDEEFDEFMDQIIDFLGRARQAGMV